jgi:molecular chaperone HscB
MPNFNQNFFTLFELPESYDINLSLLTERYHALQKTTHPDRFANAGDQEQRLALQYSAHINHAFETLRSPVTRAKHLLSLQGITFNDEQTIDDDPEFLLQQLDLRERLASVQEQSDPQHTLDQLAAECQQLIEQYGDTFSDFFAQKDYHTACIAVAKLQFLVKLAEQVKIS